jgi:putative drug exporter of the RND superfamily
MTALLYRTGRLCARRRLLVLGAWLVILCGLSLWGNGLGGTRVNDNLALPGTGTQRAANVLKGAFGAVATNGTNPIVLHAPDRARLTDTAQRAAIARVVAGYADNPEVFAAVSPLSRLGASQLAPDRRTGYIDLVLRVGAADLTVSQARQLFAVAAPARAAGLEVAAGGYLGQALSRPAPGNSEAIGLVVALVVLLLTFGSAVAAGIPILSAVFGLGAGLSVIALLSQVAEVPSTAPALATMIGLGVGIDYALFIITRHRAHVAEGLEPRESIARATASAGGAVVFAGATVTIALCSLMLAGIPIVTQMGYLSATTVVVAVLAALTLLPATLSLLGGRVNSLRVPGLRIRHDQRPHGWARWARAVARRPWPALVVGCALIAVLAAPVTGLDLGASDSGQLPRSTTARQAYDLLSTAFGPGFNGPLLVAVSVPPDDQHPQSALALLSSALRRTRGVVAVSPSALSPSGSAALLTVTPSTAPSAPATVSLVHVLRTRTVPVATRGTALTAFIGGSTAGFIDLSAQIGSRLPFVIAMVLALSFLLLLMAFQAPLIALKAVIMNLISIGAAFGVVTFVFSHGWTAGLLGIDGVAPVVSFVPLMMFAILFGLSMDYEVFLMTQIHEHWRTTGDARTAVIDGLADTGRVITSAALIMVGVFGAFLLDGNPTIKQFGLGMAVAVAVDATLIRCVLVPAVLVLLDRRAWSMPRWLARVTPPLEIEGGTWRGQPMRDAA